jgi:hypothetical protein
MVAEDGDVPFEQETTGLKEKAYRSCRSWARVESGFATLDLIYNPRDGLRLQRRDYYSQLLQHRQDQAPPDWVNLFGYFSR